MKSRKGVGGRGRKQGLELKDILCDSIPAICHGREEQYYKVILRGDVPPLWL